MIIDSKNCEVITTTLYDNNISLLRRNNLIKNFKKYNLKLNLIKGEKYDKWDERAQFISTLNMLVKFRESEYDYAIICQDDFFPIDNFIVELNKTVELLPSNWECLHLCPGYLWGREFRDMSKIGKMNPELKFSANKNHFNYDKSGRFFIDCDRYLNYHLHLWLGGPVAFLLKKRALGKFAIDYINNYDSDDRSLVRILNKNIFICREPQLGYEEECGGTSNNG